MRMTLVLCVLGFCALSSGCHLATSACRNMFADAARACEERKEQRRNRQLAESAWSEAQGSCPSASVDYAQGFKDGFADYLDAGGTGEPPPLPPRRYWAMRYQSAQGHQAIEEWYEGFSRGTATARDSNYRSWIVLTRHVRTDAEVLPAQLGFEPERPEERKETLAPRPAMLPRVSERPAAQLLPSATPAPTSVPAIPRR